MYRNPFHITPKFEQNTLLISLLIRWQVWGFYFYFLFYFIFWFIKDVKVLTCIIVLWQFVLLVHQTCAPNFHQERLRAYHKEIWQLNNFCNHGYNDIFLCDIPENYTLQISKFICYQKRYKGSIFRILLIFQLHSRQFPIH